MLSNRMLINGSYCTGSARVLFLFQLSDVAHFPPQEPQDEYNLWSKYEVTIEKAVQQNSAYISCSPTLHVMWWQLHGISNASLSSLEPIMREGFCNLSNLIWPDLSMHRYCWWSQKFKALLLLKQWAFRSWIKCQRDLHWDWEGELHGYCFLLSGNQYPMEAKPWTNDVIIPGP